MVELVLDAKAAIGEQPTWVADEHALYWMDVKAPALHRLDLAGGALRSWLLPSEIGAFALHTGHEPDAVVALRSGLYGLDFATGDVRLLAHPPYDPALFRFNEGACDSAGRFWIGVMFDPLGEQARPREPPLLHSFTLADGLRPEPDAAELDKGMAWSPDGRLFYLAHSYGRTIYRFGFDATAGRLTDKTMLARIKRPQDGIPDGAAVDEEGFYWCAMHGGWTLRRYAPDGRQDRAVRLPVSQPTMCAFAGPDLDTLYVTSAQRGLSPEQLESEPLAGGMFRLTPGVRGCKREFRVL